MKLSILPNRYYVTRDGDIVGPLVRDRRSAVYPWRDLKSGLSYDDAGIFDHENTPGGADLIGLVESPVVVRDPPATVYEDGEYDECECEDCRAHRGEDPLDELDAMEGATFIRDTGTPALLVAVGLVAGGLILTGLAGLLASYRLGRIDRALAN